jgi:hypothetical protein
MQIEKAISTIDFISDGWVRMEQLRRIRGGIELRFCVRKGRRGKRLGGLTIRCSGVHELKISHEDFGGMAIYPANHPAARQYVVQSAELRWSRTCDEDRALGVLFSAHLETVDDWIEFDRSLGIELPWTRGNRHTYSLPTTDREFVLRGPSFLLRAYAKALKAIGEPVKLTLRNRRKGKSVQPKVLHFSESYVVADKFEVRQIGEPNDE